MSSDLIRKLFLNGQPLTFGKKDIVLGNSEEPDGIYYISNGYIKIYSISDSGDEYLHLILGPKEVFPFIWAYLGVTPESVYCEALSESTVWRIPRLHFLRSVQTNLELSNAMSVQLAAQFQTYMDRLENLEYKKADERVAYRLLFLVHRFGVKYKDYTIIDAPITHDLFAQSINLVRETASRHLEKLESENIIGQYHHRYIIKDIAALVTKMSRPPNFLNWKL